MTIFQAVAITDFTERRAALRKLAQERFASEGWNSDVIGGLFATSPLVGDGSGQISPRPTISGLVGCLSEQTLVWVASGQSVEAIGAALQRPDEFGFKTSATGTGYDFARPAELTTERYNEILNNLKSEAPTMPLDTNAFGLTELTTIYDAVRITTDSEPDEVLSAMAHHVPEESLAGLRALVTLRKPEDVPEAYEMTAAMAPVVEACAKALRGDAPKAEAPAYSMPDAAKAQLIDLTLAQAGLPTIAKLIEELNASSKRIADAEAKAKSAAATAVVGVEEKASGAIPKGRVTIKPAHEVFGLARAKDTFSFDVPVWEWDSPHPHVPDADEDYVFRPFELLRVLYAIITNQRAYLHGHTGTGKTTLVEQVASRLNWPFMRINFDSEISRMDLLGRDVLTNEGGVTTSKFVDGVLPQMMSGPYIGCFDEIDFVRPDVGYVMQRALEGNGLLLTEDGGRMIKPHRMFRMFATGNTVGQGDEFGMYQGARPQSLALLDRFTVWVNVDYMSASERKKLIAARVPSLGPDMLAKIDKYVNEHLEAFKGAKVLQPISPRSYIALAQAAVTFTSFFPAGRESKAFEQAFQTTILDRASAQDRAVLKGIADRVFV